MATQLFLRSNVVAVSDRVSLATNLANQAGTTTGWSQPLSLRTTRGTTLTSPTATATVAGTTLGIEVKDNSGLYLQWISSPLDADVTIAGTITVNLWGAENSNSANVAINAYIDRINSTGAKASRVATTARTTEMALTTAAVSNFTVTPTSTAFNKGDRIRIVVFGDDAGTMGSGFTFFIGFSGPTAAANGDSYVTFTETFGFLTTDPTTTQIYPTETASAVSTAAVDLDAWTTRGGGVQTVVTNTAAGWTAPIQTTDTAGGTVVDWWTRPLTAFTLAAPVLVNVRALESNTLANASIRCELAVTAGDGSGATVWGATTRDIEIATVETAHQFYVAGDDVSVTDGQRIRIRFYIDDLTDAAMASTYTVTTFYAGAAGVTGDTYLKFGQALTEYGAAAGSLAVPRRTPHMATLDFDPWSVDGWQ